MGIQVINLDKCVADCGICVESCPTDVIRLDPGTRKTYIAYGQDCCVCFLCEMDCPVNAIYVAPSFTRPRPLPY